MPNHIKIHIIQYKIQYKLSSKNKNNDTESLIKMQQTRFLNIKNSLLELEKDFVVLKHREIKIKQK